MKYAALDALLMLACIGLGARGSDDRRWLAPVLALVIVATQLALLLNA